MRNTVCTVAEVRAPIGAAANRTANGTAAKL